MVQYKKSELYQIGQSDAPAVAAARSASSDGGTQQHLKHIRAVCAAPLTAGVQCATTPPSFKQHSGHYSKLTTKEA